MSLSETWVCIDEDNNETVHSATPYYNQLQRRWKSDYYVYVNKGLINMIVPANVLLPNTAAAYNISPKGANKITNILKGKIG